MSNLRTWQMLGLTEDQVKEITHFIYPKLENGKFSKSQLINEVRVEFIGVQQVYALFHLGFVIGDGEMRKAAGFINILDPEEV
jgi:hypothetical protein